MKYTIISIGDTRRGYKAGIHRNLKNHTEITDIQFVNGFNPESLAEARNRWPGIEQEGSNLTIGEYGIWYSQLNCWWWAANNGDLLVLEDDAIISNEFDMRANALLDELPDDYDFLAMFVPDNQLQDFRYRQNYDENGNPMQLIRAGDDGYQYAIEGKKYITRAYQGYSCVANLISQKGAKKLLDRIKMQGMYAPVDCFMFMEAHKGAIDAYAHHPAFLRPVTYDWSNESLKVHGTIIQGGK